MLEIKNLHANAGDVPILKGLDLHIRAGEVHAIMGPNGSGKSTLANVLAGKPGYTVTDGMILYDIRSGRGEPELDAFDFLTLLKEKAKLVEMPEDLLQRSINEGFSGGEKKRNEVLQMLLLEPRFAVLDETDSGLDIDALRTVANGVNHLRGPDRSLLMITHYQRLLDYIVPDFVHVLSDGRIATSGGKELALELEKKGYSWLETAPPGAEAGAS